MDFLQWWWPPWWWCGPDSGGGVIGVLAVVVGCGGVIKGRIYGGSRSGDVTLICTSLLGKTAVILTEKYKGRGDSCQRSNCSQIQLTYGCVLRLKLCTDLLPVYIYIRGQ